MGQSLFPFLERYTTNSRAGVALTVIATAETFGIQDFTHALLVARLVVFFDDDFLVRARFVGHCNREKGKNWSPF
jgi:hypothetical protein